MEEEKVKKGTQPQKKKPSKKKKKAAARATFIYIAFILLISIVLSAILVVLSNDLFAFLKDDKEITIVIPEDAGTFEVGKMLDKAGVIEYGTFFSTFVSLSAGDSKYTEGTHVLNSSMDYRGILNELSKRTEESVRDTVSVTIPEGYTIEQIADKMEENGVVTREEFIDTIENYEFKHDFLTENKGTIYDLEGYLFPDTYEFYVNDAPVSVINKMLNNFNDKVYGEIEDKAAEMGLSLHEVVTIASLIEREAAKQEEQAKISGVIHNRLASSAYPYLNIDATIQYAVGHKEELTKDDLKIDSPYNSYTKKGLPPGPIASPGYNTLLAAVNPESHDYYFYVAKPDGFHIFTSNLDEHNKAVAEARKMSN